MRGAIFSVPHTPSWRGVCNVGEKFRKKICLDELRRAPGVSLGRYLAGSPYERTRNAATETWHAAHWFRNRNLSDTSI